MFIISAAMIVSMLGSLAQQARELPPVRVITHEDLQKWDAERKAREEAGLPPETLSAEEEKTFEAYMARLDELYAHTERFRGGTRGESHSVEKTAPTADDATYLIERLYDDMGAPYLNGRWQDLVIDEIELVAVQPAVNDDTKSLLRNVLLEYAAQGGGASDPASEAHLALAFTILGGPAYPECGNEADRLTEHAAIWAEELESPTYIEIVHNYRTRIDRVVEGLHPLGLGGSKKSKAEIRAEIELQIVQDAESAVRALLLGGHPTVGMVEKATRLTTIDFGDAAVSEDMIARLLIAFRMTLEEGKRVPKRVVKTIDKKLLWLARDARKLSVRRHWRLWAEAVAALEIRASRDLRRYVYHDGPKKETDPVIVEALEKAQRGLRRKPASLPPPRPATSQPG